MDFVKHVFVFYSCVLIGRLITRPMIGRNWTLIQKKLKKLWRNILRGLVQIKMAVLSTRAKSSSRFFVGWCNHTIINTTDKLLDMWTFIQMIIELVRETELVLMKIYDFHSFCFWCVDNSARPFFCFFLAELTENLEVNSAKLCFKSLFSTQIRGCLYNS